ncbi:MAG: hypothetical protein EOO90_06240 [Pedobacter sp.]|nr:MAG: hypothetical protein EOO90_06240 [Pedobacter sp.]
MYIFKNLLTNPDPYVQDKARYFADCFEFILNNMGIYDFPPMENHRSLLEKIRLQLVNYSAQHSAKYVLHYANNPFLDKKDEMMKCYYSSYNPLIQKLRSTLFKDPAERKLIIMDIDTFLSDLEGSIMKNAMEEIHSVLHCVENLSQHNHPLNMDYA